jgi:hypothetical protein
MPGRADSPARLHRTVNCPPAPGDARFLLGEQRSDLSAQPPRAETCANAPVRTWRGCWGNPSGVHIPYPPPAAASPSTSRPMSIMQRPWVQYAEPSHRSTSRPLAAVPPLVPRSDCPWPEHLEDPGEQPTAHAWAAGTMPRHWLRWRRHGFSSHGPDGRGARSCSSVNAVHRGSSVRCPSPRRFSRSRSLSVAILRWRASARRRSRSSLAASRRVSARVRRPHRSSGSPGFW